MGLFGRLLEYYRKGKLEERREEEERLSRQFELQQKINKLVIFSGSISEYENVVGYEVEIILGRLSRDCGVRLYKAPSDINFIIEDEDLARHLVRGNIEAIVNANYSFAFHSSKDRYETYYGLPVRKKEGS